MKEKETAINELIVNAYKQDAPKELTAKAEAIYKGGGDIKQVAAALGSWANNYYQNEALRMELSKKKIEDLKFQKRLQIKHFELNYLMNTEFK